jgi:hypothetical protein
MELKNISLHLRQSIEDKHTDTLDLSPWEISGFLNICHRSLHAYICHANEQLGPDSEAYIPITELVKIDSIFRELTDNFFPMAHSNESLRRLQIVDKDEYQRIADGLLRLSRVGEEALDLSENLSQSIRRLINP